jgi:hypothetical protein
MAHVIEYDELPDASSFAEEEIPIGALILAHQAVFSRFHATKCQELTFESG